MSSITAILDVEGKDLIDYSFTVPAIAEEILAVEFEGKSLESEVTIAVVATSNEDGSVTLTEDATLTSDIPLFPASEKLTLSSQHFPAGFAATMAGKVAALVPAISGKIALSLAA